MNLKGEIIKTCANEITIREVESGELIVIYGSGIDCLSIGSLYKFNDLSVSITEFFSFLQSSGSVPAG